MYKRFTESPEGLFTDMFVDEVELHGEYPSEYCEEKKIKGKLFACKELPCGHFKYVRKDILSNNTSCELCTKSQQLNLLLSKGFTPLKRETIDGKLTYTVKLQCGHTKQGMSSNLIYSPYCIECRDSKIQEHFSKSGAEILNTTSPKKYVTLRCKNGHTQIRKTHSGDNFRCKQCQKEERTEALLAASVVEKDTGFMLPCGHTVVRIETATSDGDCAQCIENTQITRATEFGLEYLGVKDETSRRLFRFPCGHESFLRASSLKKQPICHKCNQTYYESRSDLYLLIVFGPDKTWLKLGFSNDLRERISNYKFKVRCRVMVLTHIGLDSAREAVKLEKSLHKQFKETRLNPEEMKSYMVEGYTECYPMSEMNKIISAINTKQQEFKFKEPIRRLIG